MWNFRDALHEKIVFVFVFSVFIVVKIVENCCMRKENKQAKKNKQTKKQWEKEWKRCGTLEMPLCMRKEITTKKSKPKFRHI